MASENPRKGAGTPGKRGPDAGDLLDAAVTRALAEAEAKAARKLEEAERKVARKQAEAERALARKEKMATKTERLAEKAERLAEKTDRLAEKTERMAERTVAKADMLDRLASHLGALDVWTRHEPPGRRPRFTRDEIAAAAMRIADAEGFEAVSMRHLASELGAGTMTLYHYVRTKDELLTLVTDAVMGEVVIPPDEPLPEHWRAAITVIAHRSRDAMRRHPWIMDITDDPPLGPNSVRHFDQTLQAVSSLRVPLAEKLDIVSCIDEYVFGFCLHERNNVSEGDLFSTEAVGYINGLVATGEYPQLARLADDFGLESVWERMHAHFRDADRFDRNLTRLLDGIEASLPPDARDG